MLGPTEGFLTRLKIASYIGIALAAPVWLWEIWRFITPGLTKNEKKYAIPFVASALLLFSMGVATAVLIWPRALTWLIDVAGPSVTTGYSLTSYVSLYLLVCLVFGGVFLYPIIVVFLMIAGVVPSRTWRKWRRVAIVVICVVAAVVTPSNDPFTFLGAGDTDDGFLRGLHHHRPHHEEISKGRRHQWQNPGAGPRSASSSPLAR